MLFAAGLGTRLRPLTDDRPKALVEVNGTPLLEIAIHRLIVAGCREIIVNVHHFAEQIIGFLKKNDHFGIRIAISDEREALLETGGGLKKAAWFFDDEKPFLVCNTDVLTNLDLQKFYQKHLESGALATLAVRNRPSSRSFLFDETMRLTGWQNTKTGETRWSKPIHQFTNSPTCLQRHPRPQPRHFRLDAGRRAEIFHRRNLPSGRRHGNHPRLPARRRFLV